MAAFSETRAPGRKHCSTLDDLSPRERDVLAGLVCGLTNKQIGIELGISHRTVEIHRARLMRKLKVTSLAALLTIALPNRDLLERQSLKRPD